MSNSKKEKVTNGKAPAKKTAAQMLEALENAFLSQNRQLQTLADEIDRTRQMLTALAKRVNASIKAAEEGELTNDSVHKIIVQENIKELEGKVQFLVDQGVLTKADDVEISDQTFVVGRSVDESGSVVDPRVQFHVASVEGDIKSKLLAKKLGDVIKYSDDEPSLEVTEIYKVTQPAVKKNFEQQQVQ